jgi:hypothetical protein
MPIMSMASRFLSSATVGTALPSDNPITQATRTSPRLRRTQHPHPPVEPPVVPSKDSPDVVMTVEGDENDEFEDSDFTYVFNFNEFNP